MKHRNLFQFLNHIFTGAEYYNGQRVHVFAGHKYTGAYNWLLGEEPNDEVPKYNISKNINNSINSSVSDYESSSIFNLATHPEYFI